jgi:tetratricopeptide (TPR) repeat protein
VSVVGSELEALRIEVLRGGAAEALDGIEARLALLRSLWERRQRGEEVAEAPDDGVLAGTFAAGLDIARRASAELERWGVCLELLDELEQLDRALGAAEHELTRERFHRWMPLARLGRTAEAIEVIEGCLEGFRRARDARGEVRALSALASVRAEQGDLEAATELEREALVARERFASPSERAGAHVRLACFLRRGGRAAEAADHALVAAAYQLAAAQDARVELRELCACAAEAAGPGPAPEAGEGSSRSGARASVLAPVPRLVSVLDRPAFAPLRRFLSERGIAAEALQARIDDLAVQAFAGVDRGRGALPMDEVG